jgi:hypothetical protein
MGKTTFTGPIRAGNVLNTSGTTLGQDVKNVGSVVMAQLYPITQALTATALGTTVVLPANSHVLNIQMLNTVAWDATNTLSVGTTSTATELVALTAMTVGLVTLSPGTDATRTALWDDIGTTDKRIFVKSANTGAGVGTLVVRYVQAQDTV